MNQSDRPPGWSYNPSAWSSRLPVLALALAGCGIATYLGLYQLGLLAAVWEPFFADGSTRILKQSAVARLLPVPDALLGAAAYLCEAVLESLGGPTRWRTLPGAALATGGLAFAMGVAGVVLVILQAGVFHAFCTLCLVSAACSVSLAGCAAGEFLAALRQFERERRRGISVWHALLGRPALHRAGGTSGAAPTR